MSGGFAAIPHVVLDSPAYARLGHPAKTLLIDIARQYIANNNGQLLTSLRYLKERGWKSSDTINNAKRELIDCGFIYETVKGHRPNKASWFAITWYDLDANTKYDVGAIKGFKVGLFLEKAFIKNASLSPPNGAKAPLIAPPNGVETIPFDPSRGAIRPFLVRLSSPSGEHHLEVPSTCLANSHVNAHDP